MYVLRGKGLEFTEAEKCFSVKDFALYYSLVNSSKRMVENGQAKNEEN